MHGTINQKNFEKFAMSVVANIINLGALRHRHLDRRFVHQHYTIVDRKQYAGIVATVVSIV